MLKKSAVCRTVWKEYEKALVYNKQIGLYDNGQNE
jgi:hypothetical protein